MNHEKVRVDIAAWALPRENIPFRLIWTERIDFDRIVISLPKSLEMVELLNVGRHSVSEEQAIIYELKEAAGAPNYFGGVVRTRRIPRTLSKLSKFSVRFERKRKVINEHMLEARVFRPLVEVLEAPESIEIVPGEDHEIPISMKYTGFGDVNIRIKGIINGRIVTRGESYLYEIMKQVANMGLQIERTKKPKGPWRTAKVSPEFVRGITKKIIDYVNQGSTPEDLREAIENIRGVVKTESFKRSYLEALNARVEEVIVGTILDLKNRNPTGNVKLASGETAVEATFEQTDEELIIRVKYTDAVGNRYSPVNIPIRIRSNAGKTGVAMATIPITVQKWESNPFQSVETMKIGNR